MQTVNDGFSKLNKDLINLDSDRTKAARSSRDWLIDQLISLPDKIDDFPLLFAGKHIKYGSFARNTKIRPLDDIDLILTFNASSSTYLQNGQSYTLFTHSAASNLRKLSNDDGTLNSIKVVNKVVSSLNKIEHYKSAEIKRKQEAAVLNLASYEWSYDIVPSFYTDTGYYLIPDGSGSWKATDPRIDQQRIDDIVGKHGKKALQLIRTLKYWNRQSSATTISPYLFENIIINYLNGLETLNDFIDINLINFWFHVQSAIHLDVSDPKGFQGNLNTLSYDEKIKVAAKAKDHYEKGYTAFKIETEDKNQQKAMNKWSEIFTDFPKYE